MESIYFFKEDYNIDLRKLKKYKKWLEKVAKTYEYTIYEINYVFCSDEYLHKINLQYLNHDTYTDIITFDLKQDTSDNNIEADIFISVERVKENAKNLKIDYEVELARVMVHGLLHLIGLSDKTDSDKQKMRSHENLAIELL